MKMSEENISKAGTVQTVWESEYSPIPSRAIGGTSIAVGFTLQPKVAVARLVAEQEGSPMTPKLLLRNEFEPARQEEQVKNPKHYTSHPSGVECIDITEHMTFNLGNVIKYVWREALKGKGVEDLKKARWYLEREIQRREKNNNDKIGTISGNGGAGERAH